MVTWVFAQDGAPEEEFVLAHTIDEMWRYILDMDYRLIRIEDDNVK